MEITLIITAGGGGKSTTRRLLLDQGIPAFDADDARAQLVDKPTRKREFEALHERAVRLMTDQAAWADFNRAWHFLLRVGVQAWVRVNRDELRGYAFFHSGHDARGASLSTEDAIVLDLKPETRRLRLIGRGDGHIYPLVMSNVTTINGDHDAMKWRRIPCDSLSPEVVCYTIMRRAREGWGTSILTGGRIR
jgi:hypothetical protein